MHYLHQESQRKDANLMQKLIRLCEDNIRSAKDISYHRQHGQHLPILPRPSTAAHRFAGQSGWQPSQGAGATAGSRHQQA